MTKNIFKFTLFILLFFLLLIGHRTSGGAQSPMPNIIPGIGVEDFFQLGMTYDDAEKQHIYFLKKIFSVEKSTLKHKESDVLFSDIGLRLFFNDFKKAHKIVIYNPEFRTTQYVRVFSKLDDVLSAYGKPMEVIPEVNSYYLKYSIQGIGFKIFSKTDTVREIVIFKKDENLRLLKESAQNKNADASYNLGYMYFSGEGITRNYAEAVYWYRKAAELGNAYSQNNLGYMNYSGLGVTQDYKEAVSWFRKAAEQGDVIGLSKLGEYYEYGKGMEANYSEALRLYKKAAEQGDDESKKAVNRLSEKKWGLKNLQLLLTKRGFDPGPIDGKLNPKTMKAVQKFHDATSLDVGKYNIMAIHTYLSRETNEALPSVK